MEAISASRPQEMKSSTSQRAGSSRTFLKTMYLTSGAKVMTRRLRTRTSPVVLYSCQSACASSAETRFFVVLETDIGRAGSLLAPTGGCIKNRHLRTDRERIGHLLVRPHPLFGVFTPW